MSSAPSIEELATRLSALEDERAILRTLYQYGHSIDYGLEESWVDCFTDDGIFDVRMRNGEPFMRYEGRQKLHEMVAEHTRPPVAYHKHLIAEPVIDVEGDTAKVDTYFARLDSPDDGGDAVVTAIGRYRDEFVRSPDGRWRIRIRLAEIQNR